MKTRPNSFAPFTQEMAITRKSGIAKSGFVHKELGEYAINPSLNCECKCLYCSSHCVLGRLPTYREYIGDWWHAATFVGYENIIELVDRDAKRLNGRDEEVVFSSVVDPYQSGLVKKGIPREILKRLAPTTLRLRVLTKMITVTQDLAYIADVFGDRATVGTSIPVLNPELCRVIEPFASPVELRQRLILGKAKEIQMRRYIMACPIIPATYRDYDDFAERWAAVVDQYEPEKIWFEPLNGRGKNLDEIEHGLRAGGYADVISCVGSIRTKEGWTQYTIELLGWVQRFAREYFDTARVRFLLYSSMLTKEGRQHIVANGATVVWL